MHPHCRQVQIPKRNSRVFFLRRTTGPTTQPPAANFPPSKNRPFQLNTNTNAALALFKDLQTSNWADDKWVTPDEAAARAVHEIHPLLRRNMIPKRTNNGTAAVPSRNALRLLRQLALAGSTVGGFCTLAAITYDMHRRVRVAERIVENKRALQTSAPNYDAASAAKRLSRMMEAAEAGEFMGAESVREDSRRVNRTRHESIDPGIHGGGRAGVTDGGRELPNLPDSLLEPTPFGIPQAPGPRLDIGGSGMPSGSGEIKTRTPSAKPAEKREPSLTEKMHDLLSRGRPIDAAEIFLEGHAATLDGISSERKELAVQAFFVNCRQGNVYVARAVFKRLEEVDTVSVDMWKTLMLALAKRGSIESTAALYSQYRLKFPLPPEMVDVVMRCLIESQRLTTAKWVLMRNLHIDRGCGLCGAYLAGLWKKTRSIELINGQLKNLLITLPRLGKMPTEKLFNPVIKAYVEFGRPRDAEALVHDMATNYGLPLSCRTMGLLLYSKALQSDWTGVEDGLEKMHKARLTRQKRDFIRIFDRLFLEYWVTHSGAEIRDFLFRGVDKFNIVPDQILYKHILEAFVEKGDMDMISELSNLAEERSWNIRVNEEEFLEVLRARRHALEDGPVGFWQMLQAARLRHGQAATSQHILGYDQMSFPSAEVNKMPFTQSPMPWYQRSLQEETPSKPVDQYLKLYRQMAQFIHSGRMPDALKSYRGAKIAGFRLKHIHGELALIATVLEHGISAARQFIDTEWKAMEEATRMGFVPDLFYKLLQIPEKNEAKQVKRAVLRFYHICLTHKNMIVKHHITSAVSRRLIIQKKPDIALDLLATIHLSRYRDAAKFDSVFLKMFARAFAELHSLAGIRWTILSGLARDDGVKWDFVVEIRRILGVLHRTAGPSPSPEKTEQLEYLDHIAVLLGKKSEGDTNMEELPIKTDKRPSPQQNKQPPSVNKDRLYKKEDIRETLETWVEDAELVAVLQTIFTDVEAVDWKEKPLAPKLRPMIT